MWIRGKKGKSATDAPNDGVIYELIHASHELGIINGLWEQHVTYGLLHGSHEISIDEKGRMLIPAAIRHAIIPERDASVFAILGQNNKIWLYPDAYYEDLVKQERPELLPSDASLDFDHLTFSTAHKIPVDKQCRVLLPDLLMKYTGTENAVTVIGSRDHAEVWNRKDYFAHLDDLRQRRKEIADAKRKNGVPANPG